MANTTYSYTLLEVAGAVYPQFIIADVDASKPSSGLIVGSLCFALDTDTLYKATDATTWVEVGGGGGGYSTVEDEGTPVTQRTTQNFTGAGVSVVDSGGKTVINIPGGAGSGATGTTSIDFGAFPGASDTSVTVTGQATIAAGSIVNAWMRLEATADHSADEHLLETIKISAGNIVAGTGFTIYGINTSELFEPLEVEGAGKAASNAVGMQTGAIVPTIGGIGTRIYGLWTVAWKWE